MNTGKEQWIDDILNSTAGMQRAQAPASMRDTIYGRIQQARVIRMVPLKKVWLAAASVLLLMSLNFYILRSGRPVQPAEAEQAFINAYGLSGDMYGGLFEEGGK
jgi:hypothetical protein